MSQWTHLAGIIRIDNFKRLIAPGAPTAEDVIRILLEDAPVGSEGGCNLHFIEWPEVDDYKEKDHTNIHEGSVYWGDAIISADLRDVGRDDGEIEEIKQWFTGLAKKFWDAKLLMRQAVLEIDVEYKYQRVLHLEDQEENRWIDITTFKEAEEEKAKEPEIVQCSCGETFDWEHWDRKILPMPDGIHEAIRHLDMGHTLMRPKEAEGVE